MALLDDFKENNKNEDRIDGAEDYQTEVWESNAGIDDVSGDDDDEVEAETIPKDETAPEKAKGIAPIKDDPEAELSS